MCYTSDMASEPPISQRRLEERITYCEQLADALNGVTTDLQKRVLALELQNRALAQALQEQREATRALGQANEKPPHY